MGAQSVTSEEHFVRTYGEDFPAPGEATVSSAAKTFGYEDKQRVINAGFFLQELLGFKDRYFLTLGLRMDGNSAFGENLGLEAYPKASFSYVVSDEGFWNSAWGQLKLRTAWGQAGRAPGAFDAVVRGTRWAGETCRRSIPATSGTQTLGRNGPPSWSSGSMARF